MGPAQGALGIERENRFGLEQPQVLEGLVVEGAFLAGHPDLQGHAPHTLGLWIHVAVGVTLGVAGLEHVEILGPHEGQVVVEAPLHQVHEGAGGEGGVVAVHHGGEVALGGAQQHGGPAQQAGQGVEFAGDGIGEGAHQQGLGGADAAQGGAARLQEGFALLGIGGAREGLELVVEAVEQLANPGLVVRGEARQDPLSPGGGQGLAAARCIGQGTPALGPQVIAGVLDAVLQVLQVPLVDRQGVAQQGGRIGHRVAAGQGRQGRCGRR